MNDNHGELEIAKRKSLVMRMREQRGGDILLAGVFMLLNMFDCWSTLFVVHRVGLEAEVNPLMRYILSLGSWPFVFVKIMVGVIVTIIMLRYELSKTMNWMMNTFTIVFVLVCLNNAYQIWKIIHA